MTDKQPAGAEPLDGGLPPQLTAFVGRQRERARIDERLHDPAVRWLTVTGPGGVGKTRLAIETARTYAADTGVPVVFTSLVTTFTAEALLARLAGQLDPLASDREPLDTIGHWVANRRILLLLDNAEYLLPHGEVLSALLTAPGCEELTLLVTSRAPFDRNGEHVYPLGPLPLPNQASLSATALDENDAMRLFLARARQANADLDLVQAEPRIVAEICHRLDGLPLAIELAAARTRTLSLPALLARLDKRLPVLTGAPADADRRHRTMRDAIAWGYDLLGPEEQHFLQRLAVFSGGFSDDFARRIAAGREAGHGYPYAAGYGLDFTFSRMFPDPGLEECADLDRALPLAPLDIDTETGIQRLLDWSLIQPSPNAGDHQRYVMLETIREFALERLEAGGEAEAVQHAFAALILAFVEASNEGTWSKIRRLWTQETIDPEMANIRAASEWFIRRGPAAADLALRISDCMTILWQLRGLFIEGRGQLERVLTRGTGSHFRRSTVYSALGFMNWVMGDDERAEIALQQGLAIARMSEIRARTGILHFFQALVEWRKGPHRLFTMLEELELAMANFDAWSDLVGQGVCKLAFGEAARLTEDFEGALALFDEAFALHSVDGYEWGLATARYFAGEARRELGQLSEAAELICDGLRRYWELGDVWGAGGCVCGIACLAAAHQEWPLAARFLGAAKSMRERVHAVLPPTHKATYDEIELLIRGQTGDAPFAEGRHLAVADVVAEALTAGARFAHGESAPVALTAPKKLTRIQKAVIEHFAQGLDHAQIAIRMDRAPATIYLHTNNVLKNWDLTTYEELRERARELGFGRASQSDTAAARGTRRKKHARKPGKP